MRSWITRPLIAATIVAIAWTAPAAAAPTQVLQAPSSVGPPELHRLRAILASADGAPVVLRVPGSASIEASEDDLRRLAEAALRARFYVVQQGDAEADGAAAVLTAFSDGGFLQPGAKEPSGEAGELWRTVGPLTGCSEPCRLLGTTRDAPAAMNLNSDGPAIEADLSASQRPLAPVLSEPAPGGGPGPEVLVAGLLILIACGLAGVALARARRRPEPEPPPPPPPPPPVVAAPRPRPVPAQPAPRPPSRSGRGRRAQVVSVLDPEGYVEVDGCLRRARWASNGGAEAVPGDWVDIEPHGRRLWAYAAARPTAPAGRSNERRRK